MHASLVVIGPESIERPCQVVDMPEGYVVQILPSDCTDQPFDERMGARDQGVSGEFLVKRPWGYERAPDTAGARHIDRVQRREVAVCRTLARESHRANGVREPRCNRP